MKYIIGILIFLLGFFIGILICSINYYKHIMKDTYEFKYIISHYDRREKILKKTIKKLQEQLEKKEK